MRRLSVVSDHTPVLIVHQEASAREMLLHAVRAAGYDAVAFEDPLKALNAIEKTESRVCVVVTRLNFGKGKLNEAALGRMVRHNVRRDIGVVFVGRAENEHHVQGEGVFIPHPVDPQAVVDAIARILTAAEHELPKPRPLRRDARVLGIRLWPLSTALPLFLLLGFPFLGEL